MREYRFTPEIDVPVVSAIITGPKGSRRVRLVFDTGCAITEINDRTMRFVGYRSDMKLKDATVTGVKGVLEVGELHHAQKLFVLGEKFEVIPLISMEMDDMLKCGYDGLLGWNIIRQFRLEMDGPGGHLRVF